MVLINMPVGKRNGKVSIVKFQLSQTFSILIFAAMNASLGPVKARELAYTDTDIQVRTDASLGIVSEKFLSFTIDTSFFRHPSSLNLLKNLSLVTMMRALKPAILRVGGTAADLLIFDEDCNQIDYADVMKVSGVSSSGSYAWQSTSFPNFRLCGEDWKSLNEVVSKTDLTLLFDLNVLLRTSKGTWNPDNAARLLNFSQKNNFHIDWQLEPNSFLHTFGTSLPPEQLAKDFRSLSLLLSKYRIYQSSQVVGPDVTNPRTSKELTYHPLLYLDKFLVHGKRFISAVTWHQYYVNGRSATQEAFMNYSILNTLAHEIRAVRSVVSKHINGTFPVWISETSSAWGGGAPGLSDHFISTFMWLDKLGMAAKLNISVVIRQNFIGSGHYGLIDMKTLQPNPDYWVSLLYKMTVGRLPLELAFKKVDPNVRLYAHCPTKSLKKNSNVSLVVFGLNLGNYTFRGSISKSVPLDLELYSLTAPQNNVLSKSILLNGQLLRLTQSGTIPSLKPLRYKTQAKLMVTGSYWDKSSVTIPRKYFLNH